MFLYLSPYTARHTCDECFGCSNCSGSCRYTPPVEVEAHKKSQETLWSGLSASKASARVANSEQGVKGLAV